MYFIYYFIRIFREIFGRRKLQKILILALLFIVLAWCFTKLGSFAYGGLEGDTTYTDGNNSIYMYYDSYLNDLAVRLMNSYGNDVDDLIDRLSNSKMYSFIVLRGQSNLDMNNDFQHLRVVLFQSSSGFNDSSAYNIWHDMPCQYVYNANSNVIIYDFTDMSCSRTVTTGTFYFPYMLINRYNDSLVQVLSNRSGTNSSDIVSAINSQTEEIQNQTTAIEEGNDINQATQDFMTDDTINNSNMSIDTADMSVVDSNGVDNFIMSILTSFQTFINNIGNEVEYITIPIPHGNETIQLPSNLLSKYIDNTWFEPVISAMWYFAFGTYLIFYIRFMIKFWSSGEFSNSGLAYFIEHLENNDPFINASMM